MFKLSRSDYEKIVHHARQNLPEEACGLIVGKEEGSVRQGVQVYLLENKDHSAEHFTISPSDQLKVLTNARKAGLKIIGAWHSHPSTPSRMSEEDIRLARDETRSYLILSLASEIPVLHSFRVRDGVVSNEELQIAEGEEL